MPHIMSPCKGCKDRDIYCHVTCDAYIDFISDCIQQKKKIEDKKRGAEQYFDYKMVEKLHKDRRRRYRK